MDQQTPTSSSSIPWHPAFVQAIKLELEAYRDALEFITEYRLTSEPLEIDMVIVKKAPGLVIEKNIARTFRLINIMEYKSPDDYFSVYDFYKVLSYAFLYMALNKIAIEDITVSIIESRHPRNLLKYLEEKNCRITEISTGIYHIDGYPIAIQIIESKKLPETENLWLKGLTKDLNVSTAEIILKESRKRGEGMSAELAAYLYALINANIQTMQEVLTMADEGLPFDRWVEETGLAAKWEARAAAQAEKATWEKAINLLKQGYTVEELERMRPSSHNSLW
jgi:hypothetical protein